MSDRCTEACWTPVHCPDHDDTMPPRGRSAPLSAHVCCENYVKSDLNPRHLWNEHDSTRWYTDRAGWDEHERTCPECGPDDEDEEAM